ncbi:MAG: hypothetical protein JSR66_26315 [Proteobacteria bacterium]|nr:hypothetical protein [Pseudomonadota bacterium]
MARNLSKQLRYLPFVGALLVLGWVSWASIAIDPTATRQDELAQQRIQYDDDSTKTILELQRFRATTRVPLKRADGMSGFATLVNLNPAINTWYLLTLTWPDTDSRTQYHLENPLPTGASIRLLSGDPSVLAVTTANGFACSLWSNVGPQPLVAAGQTGLPYAPLCTGMLYLRNPVAGHRTSLELITDLLRNHLWQGDRVISFVKKEFYRDRFLERSGSVGAAAPATAGQAPLPALVSEEFANQPIAPQRLAIDLDADGGLLPGEWYAVHGVEGVTVSVLQPGYILRSLLTGHEASVNPLTAVESQALVYLVAFDLQSFDLHFVLGTEHPRVDWSERPPRSSQDARLPGPDGIATPAPLVANGMVSPADASRTIATFAGGFKRSHGAFKFGPLSERNHGSHYGFLEEGVVFSKLQPGLATVWVASDGRVQMKTWQPSDDNLLEHVRYARQNGVPLIEYEAHTAHGVPGELVNLWGPGNWSGSAGEDLRTVRAGLCLQNAYGHRYLIYGYFSAATPSAMARVFQAYQCTYAMHLDMNALEHTYLALYVRSGQQTLVEHLVQGMEEVDHEKGNEVAPRFLSFPDDRDFFYLTRGARTP